MSRNTENLERIHQHLDQTRKALLQSFSRLSQEEIDFQCRNEAWSIGQVVQHLLLVEQSVLIRFEKLLSGELPSDRSWFNRIRKLPLRWATNRRVRVKTLKRLDPTLRSGQKSKEELLSALETSRAKIKEFMEKHRGENLSQYRFTHRFFGALTIYEWLYFLGYHEERHRRQIEEIKSEMPLRK